MNEQKHEPNMAEWAVEWLTQWMDRVEKSSNTALIFSIIAVAISVITLAVQVFF